MWSPSTRRRSTSARRSSEANRTSSSSAATWRRRRCARSSAHVPASVRSRCAATAGRASSTSSGRTASRSVRSRPKRSCGRSARCRPGTRSREGRNQRTEDGLMPQTLTFPGVYIEEIPSSVRPITGVATSIAAFVDYFTRGPIDTAVQVLSVADFEREFGGLNAQSEASYAVHQFFLNGGAQAWIIRVGRDSASPNHLATASLDIDDTAATPLVRVTAGERIRGKSVENPGTWANFLRVEVDDDVAVPPDPTQTAAELFNLTVSEVAVRGGQQVTLRRETFRNLTFRPGAVNNALEVVNAGSKLVQLELLGTLATPFAAILPAATGTVGTALPTSPSIPTDGSAFNVKVNGGSNISCTLNYVGAAIRAEAGTDPKLANVSVRLWGNGSTALPYRFAVVARTGAGEITPTDQLSFNNATATDR